MTASGYAMLIVSWSALVILSVWCLVLLLRAERLPKNDDTER